MGFKALYETWVNFPDLDVRVREDLKNVQDEKEIEDRFYKNLEFGTAGMRGLLGAGTNRMNIYMVRKAALGLGRYIESKGEVAKSRGVVIAYDSRHMSPEFAMETAKTIGNLGIKVYLFESLRTTPELSFAVRYLHAFSGVVITASHNPSAYNGFKVYGEDGAQIASEVADAIVANVDAIENPLTIKIADERFLVEQDLLTMIGEKVDKAYLTSLQELVVNRALVKEMSRELSIVYTPLHGTGNRPVLEALNMAGFLNVSVVAAQAQPDGDFPTVDYPNPEEASAFALAMEEGKKQNADVLLATDPDADRVGVAVLVEGSYKLLTGNQIGAILLHYLITEKKAQGTLEDNAVVLKTIVTSELGSDIAKAHDLKTIDVLTGFKYIAEKIKSFEETKEHTFLFGYEESYGYLIGDFVRDKDAVQTCLLIAEVAAFYKKQGKNLYDGLQAIFETYGYYVEHLQSITLEGKDGSTQIQAILEDFRNYPPSELAGVQVRVREDYATQERVLVVDNTVEEIRLPKSNVLKYILENGAWVCIRPSGTEPKIKFYYGVKEATLEESQALIKKLQASMEKRLVTFSN
ncbi:phospho-sugar mutase [Pseudogracilibacillus sp. ICA-222130]|uniref:phospho-sugar mutase n=1 Tax=Pseudogracilibacillus sp. ICA-222130 TaxID=3134655 RepID=UPI0030C46C61